MITQILVLTPEENTNGATFQYLTKNKVALGATEVQVF